MQALIDNVLSHDFECIAGPLDKSEDFKRLANVALKLPEYPIGTAVDVHLKVEVDGEQFEKWVAGVVSKTTTTYTDSGNIFHMYRVSAGIPQEWHSPKVIAPNVSEAALRHRAPSS